MTEAFAIAVLCTVLVGLSGWLFGKAHAHTLQIEELANKLANVSRENDALLDSVSRLSIDNARLSERINMLEDKNKELEKKLDEAENRVAAQVAEKVEKRWDAGLEKMMAWNPYDTNDNGGA